MEPTKHQYDVDTETVIGFLRHYGLDKDFAINIEVNHATLAGHTFEHELQAAADAGYVVQYRCATVVIIRMVGIRISSRLTSTRQSDTGLAGYPRSGEWLRLPSVRSLMPRHVVTRPDLDDSFLAHIRWCDSLPVL
ncbi:MAG: hypothetical protein ACLR6J_18605 [Parabacteroides merdae]